MKASLNTQIFIAVIASLLCGLTLQQIDIDSSVYKKTIFVCGIIGNTFVDLLKMILIPLVFTSITVGVAHLRHHHNMHQIWKTTLVFFLFTSSIAVFLGLGASNLFHLGAGLDIHLFDTELQKFNTQSLTLQEFTSHFFHSLFINPLAAMVHGDILAVVIFALFLGIALIVLAEKAQTILNMTEELLAIIMLIVNWIMKVAPIGIFALLTKLVATQNIALLSTLAKFIVVVIGTTLFHGFVVLPLVLFAITRISPLFFFKGARESLITAFATSSSSATLPVTLRCAETHLKVDKNIAGFVVSLGATVNMDGTALYEAAAALFIANLTGIELNLLQQTIVCITAMLAAIGAPGIPSAGMVTMVMVLQSVGLPAEAIAILLPIDRLLDAVRTVVNVEGDMIGSLVVQKLTKLNQ
ncbi:Proton/glutamate symport protein @ Sodium/glutamate symport protein [Crenothrix polyspora]|uniref:Proton/glutamate symport protein @ Sodium/glutamate symport protein n=1 Tax=Crenothrix polyspora TaxID=360316 RepID=A0A1R4H287_9GAMM|nr:dicarboxylate/amino acid:cation symporter [Crenothrix polyspora]SJM90333.1 Proton/glutamate symport protein @ Sodium/glutamate symport protein [Crenothrix polyspora]